MDTLIKKCYYLYGENMKKIIFIILILLFPTFVYANSKEEVKLYKCIDGDTIKVIYNDKKVKIRLISIDTPEINENYSIEAKNFTCNKLKSANKIEIEFDKNSKKKDKYNRYLAWVFYDDILLQNELVKKGYAEVKYLYDDYKYTDILKESKKIAQNKEKGIYSKEVNKKEEKNTKDNIKKSVKKFLSKLNANLNKLFTDILEEIL